MPADRPPVRCRPASPNDAVAIDAIYLDSWNRGFGHLLGHREASPDRLERWAVELADSDVDWWVAERDGIVAGFVGVGAAEDNADVGEVHTIAVDPGQWRSGVGRELMRIAVERLSGNFDDAVLWTPAGYPRGHAFYEAAGWQRDGAERADGAQVRFRRRLGPGFTPG